MLPYWALVTVGAGVWNRTCIGVSDGAAVMQYASTVDGDSARSLRSLAKWCAPPNETRGKDGRRNHGGICVPQMQAPNCETQLSPYRCPSFPFLPPHAAHHSASERSERAEPPPMTNALRRHSWKRLHRSATRCQPQQVPKPGRAASPREHHIPVGATAQSPEAVAHAGEIPGRGFIWQ